MPVAPYLGVPDELTDVMSGSMSTPVIMDDGGRMMMSDLGPPHITLAMGILGLVLLKVFTESNLVSTEPAVIKVSLLNIAEVGVMASVFIILAKVGVASLLRRGIVIPGAGDFVGAL